MQTENNSVLVVILCGAERDGWINQHLFEFCIRLGQANAGRRAVSLEMMFNISPVDAARNALTESFLRSGCDWLCMIDNDMVPVQNLLDIVDRAEEHMDIIGPAFHCIANLVHGEGAARQVQTGVVLGWQPLAKTGGDATCDRGSVELLPQREWVELGMISSGTMLVRRRCFERMAKPYFRFVYDEGGRVTECEDLYFSRKAREAGLSIWGNRNFYVDHYKTFPLSLAARAFPGRDLSGLSGRFPGAVEKAGAKRS